MNREAAIQRAQELLGDLAVTFSVGDLNAATEASVTVDSAGRLPSDPGWEATYEPYWAAAELADLLDLRARASGGVESFSSEGSSFKVTGPDYAGLAKALRAKSPISGLTGAVGFVDLDPGAYLYVPTSRRWR